VQINRYQRTMGAVKAKLVEAFPGVVARKGATHDVSHTLWMIEEVRRMGDQAKIDRWVGWICAKAHSLGIIDRGDDQLSELRALARQDVLKLAGERYRPPPTSQDP